MITSLPFRAIGSNLFREFGWPIVRPFNLTYSVTGRCNSRCLTCNIWKSKPDYEMTLEEWKHIITDIGKCPEWITISGGEPFLREDLHEIILLIERYNSPYVLNIATNGILTEKIIETTRKFSHKRLIVNVSIDGTKKVNDMVRGEVCHEKAVETVRRLKDEGVAVGVHMVVSRYNAETIADIAREIKVITPDSFICQIAEKRKELQNLNHECAPSISEYEEAVDIVKRYPSSRITKFLRNSYYKKSIEHLKKGYAGRCFAGVASAHINYNGDLWACCVNAEKLGSLLETSFEKAWNSLEAKRARDRIKHDKCSCTLANSAYSNFMCWPF